MLLSLLNRIESAIWGSDGMLLFGIGAAYIFAVMQAWWPMLRTLRPDAAAERLPD
jgi:hypothetical protein